MGLTSERRGRRITLVVAALTFTTNAASIAALRFLPSSDPFDLTRHFALYSIFGCAMSVLSILGVWKRNVTFVSIFANYLFLDALVSAAPHFLLASLLWSLPQELCATLGRSARLHLSSSSSIISSSSPAMDPSPPHPQHHHLPATADLWGADACAVLVWSVRAVLGIVLVAATAAQWACIWRVREYARLLDRIEAEAESRGQGWCSDEEEEEGVGATVGRWRRTDTDMDVDMDVGAGIFHNRDVESGRWAERGWVEKG